MLDPSFESGNNPNLIKQLCFSSSICHEIAKIMKFSLVGFSGQICDLIWSICEIRTRSDMICLSWSYKGAEWPHFTGAKGISATRRAQNRDTRDRVSGTGQGTAGGCRGREKAAPSKQEPAPMLERPCPKRNHPKACTWSSRS